MEEYTLMDVFAAHLGEVIVGVVLLVFGWAFQTWAKNLKTSSEQWGAQLQRSTDRILTKLEGLVKEFHDHRVDIENRVTRVETKVDIDRIERREARISQELKRQAEREDVGKH